MKISHIALIKLNIKKLYSDWILMVHFLPFFFLSAVYDDIILALSEVSGE